MNPIESYANADKFWDSLTEEQQIQAAVVIFRKLNEQVKAKGSFRFMIYNVFGWSMKSYSPIYAAGGMNINNMLNDAVWLYSRIGENDYYNKSIS